MVLSIQAVSGCLSVAAQAKRSAVGWVPQFVAGDGLGHRLDVEAAHYGRERFWKVVGLKMAAPFAAFAAPIMVTLEDGLAKLFVPEKVVARTMKVGHSACAVVKSALGFAPCAALLPMPSTVNLFVSSPFVRTGLAFFGQGELAPMLYGKVSSRVDFVSALKPLIALVLVYAFWHILHTVQATQECARCLTPGQGGLRRKHGTPAEFAEAAYRGVPGDISMAEARAAVAEYQKEWDEA